MRHSSTIFTHAITRKPGTSFIHGLTSAGLGKPNLKLTREQHQAYCSTLEECGCSVTILEADEDYPDSTFVEDTAVIAGSTAIITNPGAATRKGEVVEMKSVLNARFKTIEQIKPPGTLDGGDICQADDMFFIGISERTNPDGANQLAEILSALGYNTEIVDVRGLPGSLHLKSDIAYLGDNRILVTGGLYDLDCFQGYEKVLVNDSERYSANCVKVNDHILIADGFPKLAENLSALGYKLKPIEITEFRKLDGGLSCLSLRYKLQD